MIEIAHLRKQYEGTVALENLTLSIPQGEVFGLIGPNGAGKTTLLRILATLQEPTYGRVLIDGVDALAEPWKVRPVIGYMSDVFSLYDTMLTWEYLDHFARCRGVSASKRAKVVDEVLQLVGLDTRHDALIKTLSRGMRQRLCFARMLVHEPKVLLLDEPASGLDPAGRVEFREFLKQLHALGRTILISSHILTEMADFCTSVGILEQGRLLTAGRVEDILRQMQPHLNLEIEVLAGTERLCKLLETWPGCDGVEAQGERVRCVWTAGRDRLPELHRAVVAAEVDLVALSVKTDNLEDLYMKISGHRTS